MEKTRQQELTRWLKTQKGPAQRWLRMLTGLGLLTGIVIVTQAWLLATILHALIIENIAKETLTYYFIALAVTFVIRALLAFLREKLSFYCGQAVRKTIRSLVLNQLEQLGPVWVKGKPAGSWSTIIIEQVENMQDFYARYLPQMSLAAIIPIIILVAVIPINWTAAFILFITAPLIPIFMSLVGMGAADANRRNFTVLARLSGHFLDRLRGIDTLRLFNQGEKEVERISQASEDFRKNTMEVLRIAFLSSAVLEFFASVSIALVAVYFGFSYLGDLNFGHYGFGVTLFAGFFVLILSPEYFQPLRDLGSFYHAKAQAIGAAEALVDFLAIDANEDSLAKHRLSQKQSVAIEGQQLIILSPQGVKLAGPLDFTIAAGEKVAIVGHSGAGKSSFINMLLGFLPYEGSLRVNGQELKSLSMEEWRSLISWVGQNPHLPEQTLRSNILLSNPAASKATLDAAIEKSYVSEFLDKLPQGLDTELGEYAARLSIGQAQRVAVARALLEPCHLLLLDEPTASLDANSERLVMASLNEAANQQTTLLISHKLTNLQHYDTIWVMDKGLIVESGDVQTLSQSNGPFATLMANQKQELS